MRVYVFLVAVVLTGVLAFLGGYFLAGPPTSSPPPESPQRETALQAEVERLTKSEWGLERKLAEATTRYREAEAALTGILPSRGDPASPGWETGGPESGRTSGGGVGTGAGAARGTKETAPEAILFGDEYEGALRKVDWETVGTNLHRIVGMLDEGAPYVQRGEPLPEHLGTAIQRLNSPILAAAIQVRDYLPGRDVNGKFSSAPFTLNAIAATLEAAGLPLDEDQAARLLAIGRDTLARDDRRLSAYGEATFELERLLDDLDSKESFYAAVYAVLSEAQNSALRPEPTRDRVRLDLFSPTISLTTRAEVLEFSNEEDLVQRIGGRIVKSLGLKEPQYAPTGAALRRWAAGIPRELLGAAWDSLDARGMVRLDRARNWGRQLLTLLQTLVADIDLEAPQAAKARGVGNILIGLQAGQGPN